MKNLFKRFYPWSSNQLLSIVASSILIGLFVFAFLVIFQPFGLYDYENEYKFWVIIGFGGVTTVVLFIYNIIKFYLVKSEPKLVFDVFLKTSSISLFNVVYAVRVGLISLSFHSILLFTGFTFAVAILIWVFKYGYRFIDNKKKNEKKKVKIISKVKSEHLLVYEESILYVKSSHNYCEIYYENNGVTEKKLLRAALRSIEKQLSNDKIVKVHRSYLVNLEFITSTKGSKSSKYTVVLKDGSEVPISKTHIPKIENYLNSFENHSPDSKK